MGAYKYCILNISPRNASAGQKGWGKKVGSIPKSVDISLFVQKSYHHKFLERNLFRVICHAWIISHLRKHFTMTNYYVPLRLLPHPLSHLNFSASPPSKAVLLCPSHSENSTVHRNWSCLNSGTGTITMC